VDEGGIVKVHGDHLVVLRRGRLFTVRIGGNDLAPVSTLDAFGEGIDPRGAWYDEMLIRGDTVIVIGFSYQRGGTEVGLFDIDREGALAHRATYHLRSNDYYSSRNYASRLVGDKLIFYTPLYLNLHRDPFLSLPAMRKWHTGATADEFRRIAPATRIYRTDDEVEPWGLTLHTVTTCDLSRREMDCESTGVLGPAGRVFYVSQGSVYVWTTRSRREGSGGSSVFRIPLESGAPTALKTSGSPIDQLSFLESDDGHLNVLLRANGRGEAMWAAESGSGSMALLRVPLASFGDGRDAAPDSAYRRVPSPTGYALQNRFVGPYLLYGSGSTWGRPNAAPARHALHAIRWAAPGSTIQSLSLPHGVDRIEAMGRHAVVVGTAGKDLHFSSVRLDDEASIPHRFTRPDAAQGETRTHGFFYKPDSADTGIVGLPVVAGGRPGHKQLRQGSAAIAFLRNDGLVLSELGDLEASVGNGGRDDGCRASCVDWYGNARPLFLRGRIFALLGYEIVEGRLAGGGIGEVRRASFAPR
ncbi:MAG TPA: beta-propeller domain-containing protein, partial [Usitatibacter sp.]|nr:beta-propeller domain-containing protein [Usitatibacter sp.]